MSEVSTRAISGALTFETVPDLYKASGAWFEVEGDLTLDLAQVTNADSAGLALLLEWLRRARAAKRNLRFANIPAQVQSLMRINNLHDAFDQQP